MARGLDGFPKAYFKTCIRDPFSHGTQGTEVSGCIKYFSTFLQPPQKCWFSKGFYALPKYPHLEILVKIICDFREAANSDDSFIGNNPGIHSRENSQALSPVQQREGTIATWIGQAFIDRWVVEIFIFYWFHNLRIFFKCPLGALENQRFPQAL